MCVRIIYSPKYEFYLLFSYGCGCGYCFMLSQTVSERRWVNNSELLRYVWHFKYQILLEFEKTMLAIRILFSIVYLVYAILYRVALLIYKKPPSIPPITDPLLTLSAVTLARKIRQREITSYEVVVAYKNRIQEIKCINAVVDDRFEEAIIEAKICDEQLKAGKFDIETLEKEKPLYGVPFSAKECCAVKGCSYTGCTLPRKGTKASCDAVVVQLLRNAGAIPLCITNTPEMCGGFDSTNRLYGHTCNPYDVRYSAGGSSGGEGAVLGAGASVIGIGSDLGGSVRIPAHFNGVFGHKPTAGLLSNIGHFPTSDDKIFQISATFGPMTRYAEDLGVMMRVLTPMCKRDLRLDVPVDFRQLKVYYRLSMDKWLGQLPVSPEIEECILKAAKHFARYGVRADKLPIEWPPTFTEITIATISNIKKFPPLLLDANDPKIEKNVLLETGKALLGLSEHTKQLLFFAMLTKKFSFPRSMKEHYAKQGETIRQNLVNLLGENGVFIYPTFHGATYFPRFAMLEVLGSAYCSIFNVFGLPAVHVPIGRNREGLPIGVQVIAAPYQDRLCLAVAKELEAAFGGWVPPSISIRS